MNAVDGQLIGLVVGLVRQAILGRGVAAARGGFHLLFAVLLGDDGYAIRESGEAVYVVAVAVSDNGRIDGLWGDFGDFGDHVLFRIDRGLGVHDNHAVGAHDEAVIRTGAALNPVHVVLDLRDFKGCGLLLRPGHLGK